MDDWFVRAANKSFVTCDKLVDSDHFHSPEASRQVFWERSLTTAVCHIPGGAHPTSCPPFYGIDNKHLLEYNKSAKEGGFSVYSDKYINQNTELDYQGLVGGLDAIMQIPQTRY
jgi:glutaconate CoA-transferase subunit A